MLNTLLILFSILLSDPSSGFSCSEVKNMRGEYFGFEALSPDSDSVLHSESTLAINGVQTTVKWTIYFIGNMNTTQDANGKITIEGETWRISMELPDGSEIESFADGTLQQANSGTSLIVKMIANPVFGSGVFSDPSGKIFLSGKINSSDFENWLTIEQVQGQICSRKLDFKK